MNAWRKIRAHVRSAVATVESQPKYLAPILPTIAGALELCESAPMSEKTEELEFLLCEAEKFVSKWRPSKKPSPGVIYIQPQWAKAVDDACVAAIRLIPEIETSDEDVPGSSEVGTNMKRADEMNVFISHSSADRMVAECFAELLRSALNLSAKNIRCTSVDGFKLAPGSNVDVQLRKEVFESTTFIALLSPDSLKSMYVMFELGARWGSERYLAPVLVRGATAKDIKPPLSAIHAILGSAESEVDQLLNTLAKELSTEVEARAAFKKQLKAFLESAEDSFPL